jgi:hypothetical protein
MCAALEKILGLIDSDVKKGLRPTQGWTAKQYAATVRALLKSPYNAVSEDALVGICGGGDAGMRVVQAMVKSNLLAYRPLSEWARDIDRGAFSQGGRVVLTATSAAHLQCMRQLRLPFDLGSLLGLE